MRQPIVAGNWKMNTTLTEAVGLASELASSISRDTGVTRVLIPPSPWIVPVHEAVGNSGLLVGAQNCYTEPSGAFTGEVAPEMLAGICEFVIAGHSERRHVLGESNELVGAKVQAVLRAGLRPILCVGETIEEREAGGAEQVVGQQLASGLAGVSSQDAAAVVIAYEPVWAIGTGHAASADNAQSMSRYIRDELTRLFVAGTADQVPILYGGSVKASNAGSYFECPDVDGALVGGASLDAAEFAQIVAAAG